MDECQTGARDGSRPRQVDCRHFGKAQKGAQPAAAIGTKKFPRCIDGKWKAMAIGSSQQGWSEEDQVECATEPKRRTVLPLVDAPYCPKPTGTCLVRKHKPADLGHFPPPREPSGRAWVLYHILKCLCMSPTQEGTGRILQSSSRSGNGSQEGQGWCRVCVQGMSHGNHFASHGMAPCNRTSFDGETAPQASPQLSHVGQQLSG